MKKKKYVSEIRIRNVDAGAVARIDQLADKAGKSRNAYLREYIETLSVLNELNELQNKYDSLVNTLLTIVSQNTKEIRLLRQQIESELNDE